MRTINVLFYGIGGQGVLTAAEVCALAALYEGYHVKKSEVKGMSQRGGSVESYVRFGDTSIPRCAAGDCDALVCLHDSEYPRLKDELKPGGIDLHSYSEKGLAAVGGKTMFLNTYMLGVLSSYLNIKEENWLKALSSKLKKNFHENKDVFLTGRKEAKK
jgi:indolepyruvate ferredoxin oxidoreductase beta subunit